MKNDIKFNESVNKKVGEVLSGARKAKGLSYRKIGKEINMSGQAIHYYESGRSVVPITVFIALSEAYGKDPIELFGEVLSK